MISKTYKIIRFPLHIFLLLFLLLCMALSAFILPDTTISDITLQRMRCQRIAKDALILEYRPEDEQPQAFSELQNMLAAWQAEQMFLQNRPIASAQSELASSNSDYVSITNAMKAILAQPNRPTDAIQVAIILNHERAYTQSLAQVTMLMQAEIAMAQLHLFLVECIAVGFILTIIVTDIMSKRRRS